MSHIFISYSKDDIEFAKHLRSLLQDKGFAVWMDETKLTPSQEWWPEIEKNIISCAAFIVIMSPSSQASKWVEREILVAEAKENPKPIFPVLLAGKGWTRLANIQFQNMTAGESISQLNPDFVRALQECVPTHSGISVPRQLSADKTHTKKTSPIKTLLTFVAVIAIILVAIILFPLILEQQNLSNINATTEAGTQAILALTPTLNPVQQVQTLDVQATHDAEIVLIARETMTAQAQIDTDASATMQGTLDAEASAISRINTYATATAMASITPSITHTDIPTMTNTATLVPTETSTRTPRPTNTPTSTATDIPGEAILYFEDFEDGEANSFVSETWTNDRFSVVELSNGNKVWSGLGHPEVYLDYEAISRANNYAISLDFYYTGAPEAFGLGFRRSSTSSCRRYELHLDPNWYQAEQRNDSNCATEPFQSGNTTIFNNRLQRETWHHVFIEVNGSSVRWSVNDRTIHQAFDDTYRVGTFGIDVWDVNNNIWFDNILIWSLED
jgi:hypothetical protein